MHGGGGMMIWGSFAATGPAHLAVIEVSIGKCVMKWYRTQMQERTQSKGKTNIRTGQECKQQTVRRERLARQYIRAKAD